MIFSLIIRNNDRCLKIKITFNLIYIISAHIGLCTCRNFLYILLNIIEEMKRDIVMRMKIQMSESGWQISFAFQLLF